MTWVGGIFLPLIIGYQVWNYYVFRERIRPDEGGPRPRLLRATGSSVAARRARRRARPARPGSVTTRRSTPRARASLHQLEEQADPGARQVGRGPQVHDRTGAPTASAASRASRSARTVLDPRQVQLAAHLGDGADGPDAAPPRHGGRRRSRYAGPSSVTRAGTAPWCPCRRGRSHLVGQVPHELHTPPAEARVGGRGPPRPPVLHDHVEGAVAGARDLVAPVAGRAVAVGVLDGVRRGLAEREEQVVGVVVGQRRGRRPAPDRAAHHGELRRIGGQPLPQRRRHQPRGDEGDVVGGPVRLGELVEQRGHQHGRGAAGVPTAARRRDGSAPSSMTSPRRSISPSV